MVRDTPGLASPSALAADLGISNAGMTGRLDTLEKAGWVQRSADADDRRRVSIEITRSGARSGVGRWGCADGPRTRSCTPSTRGAGDAGRAAQEDDAGRGRDRFFVVAQRRLRVFPGSTAHG